MCSSFSQQQSEITQVERFAYSLEEAIDWQSCKKVWSWKFRLKMHPCSMGLYIHTHTNTSIRTVPLYLYLYLIRSPVRVCEGPRSSRSIRASGAPLGEASWNWEQKVGFGPQWSSWHPDDISSPQNLELSGVVFWVRFIYCRGGRGGSQVKRSKDSVISGHWISADKRQYLCWHKCQKSDSTVH